MGGEVSHCRCANEPGPLMAEAGLAHRRAGSSNDVCAIPSRRLPDAAIGVDAGQAPAVIDPLPDDDQTAVRPDPDLIEYAVFEYAVLTALDEILPAIVIRGRATKSGTVASLRVPRPSQSLC